MTIERQFSADIGIESSKQPSRPPLLDQGPFPSAICNMDGLLVYVSPAFAAMTGYDLEELEGKILLWELNADQSIGCFCTRTFEACKNFGNWGWFPVQWQHKRGETIHARLKGCKMTIGQNEYMYSVVDISE